MCHEKVIVRMEQEKGMMLGNRTALSLSISDTVSFLFPSLMLIAAHVSSCGVPSFPSLSPAAASPGDQWSLDVSRQACFLTAHVCVTLCMLVPAPFHPCFP